MGGGATILYPETVNNANHAYATGTLGPGTYMFTARYIGQHVVGSNIDSINGNLYQIANAFIVVFDHPVGYASMHGNNIFQHFVDTQHPWYSAYDTCPTAIGGWAVNENNTNITNMTDLPNTLDLCVFELK